MMAEPDPSIRVKAAADCCRQHIAKMLASYRAKVNVNMNVAICRPKRKCWMLYKSQRSDTTVLAGTLRRGFQRLGALEQHGSMALFS